MTRKEAFDARKMYVREINKIAKEEKVEILEGWVGDTVANIMATTTSRKTVKKVLNYYCHYVQLCFRIEHQVWEEEE